MTITLTPEIERNLSRAAGRYGTTPELLALETLQERFAGPVPSLEGMALDVALADLLGEAETLVPEPPAGVKSPFDEILIAKYRAQGIDV